MISKSYDITVRIIWLKTRFYEFYQPHYAESIVKNYSCVSQYFLVALAANPEGPISLFDF